MRHCYFKVNSVRTKSAKKISEIKKYVQNDYHDNYNSESVITKNEVTNTITHTNLNDSKNIEENLLKESKKIEESNVIENTNTNTIADINTNINNNDINAKANNNTNANSELEFTPENYKIIKCTDVTSKLR